MSRLCSRPSPVFAVSRRRRSFGLDAPRPPDVGRMEAAILGWLAERMPQMFWLRAAEPEADNAPRQAATLVLMLPGGRMAVLRIEAPSTPCGPDTRALAEQCCRRRIPLSVVSTIDDVRAALRRLGIEPEED